MKCLRLPVLALLPLLAWCSIDQICEAATDTDVTELKVKRVVIEEDKITITAEATVAMVIITPDAESADKNLQFTGRHSTWIKIKADEATLTVLRDGKGEQTPDELWAMSVKAAEALKAGKEIDRIGFYRPDIIITNNQVHVITGSGYIFPSRD